jgi:hypothetical protein
LEFKTLPEPIEITAPVKAKFTEYRVYSDIVLHIAKSTRDSIIHEGITPETFVLREIVQNAVDSEIQKTGDFLTSYKKVKAEDVGKWKKIENTGTLTEDVFLFGYSTKEETKIETENKPCTLVGRFGVGLKESIFLTLYCGEHIVMIFNGHIYGFGYFYKGKLYYDLDREVITKYDRDVYPVIFRGEYNVTDKVITYVPVTTEGVLSILYPFEKPYHVNPGDKGMVYHNGVFSGYWSVPLDLNVCYVNTNQYRTKVYPDVEFVKAMEMIAEPDMSRAFADVMKKYIGATGKVVTLSTPGELNFVFNVARPKLRAVLQDALNSVVEELVKGLKEKVIVVDKIEHIMLKKVVGVGLPGISDEYIDNLKSYLRSKGYVVLSYSEAKSGKLMEIYDAITEPTISEDVMALIKLGKWLYQIGFFIMRVNDIPGWIDRVLNGINISVDPYKLDPSIANIPVKIVKPEYDDMLSDAVGLTVKSEDKKLVLLRHLPDEEKAMYVGIVIHELNHVFTVYEHGTYQWENIYYALYMIDAYYDTLRPFVANLINLALYNPKLFLQINDISNLPVAVLPKELVVNGECRGYAEIDKVECNRYSEYILKLVNYDGMLAIKQEVAPQ